MKKLFFSLFIICSSIQFAYAQIPVTDATNLANNTSNQVMNAATMGQQLTQLVNMNILLTTTLEYVQEVSSVVRDVAYFKDLVQRQQYIIQSCNRIIKNADKIDLYLIRGLEMNITSFLTTNNSLITLITSTLTTRFKMNDSERLNMLINLKNEQAELLSALNKVDMIISTTQCTNEIIKYRILR